MAASSWLALGPIGTGALGMLLLGSDAPLIFAANGLPGVGDIAAGLGLVAGITLWGLGLWWMLMALLITARYLRAGIPFNLGWWGGVRCWVPGTVSCLCRPVLQGWRNNR
jgi:tellurite resistance protein TehA-like permease